MVSAIFAVFCASTFSKTIAVAICCPFNALPAPYALWLPTIT
jgi:hypothetical protein